MSVCPMQVMGLFTRIDMNISEINDFEETLKSLDDSEIREMIDDASIMLDEFAEIYVLALAERVARTVQRIERAKYIKEDND